MNLQRNCLCESFFGLFIFIPVGKDVSLNNESRKIGFVLFCDLTDCLRGLFRFTFIDLLNGFKNIPRCIFFNLSALTSSSIIVYNDVIWLDCQYPEASLNFSLARSNFFFFPNVTPTLKMVLVSSQISSLLCSVRKPGRWKLEKKQLVKG